MNPRFEPDFSYILPILISSNVEKVFLKLWYQGLKYILSIAAFSKMTLYDISLFLDAADLGWPWKELFDKI